MKRETKEDITFWSFILFSIASGILIGMSYTNSFNNLNLFMELDGTQHRNCILETFPFYSYRVNETWYIPANKENTPYGIVTQSLWKCEDKIDSTGKIIGSRWFYANEIIKVKP